MQLGHFREQQARVVLAVLPELRIEIAEDAGAVRRPAPPVVFGETPESGDALGQFAFLISYVLG